VNVWNYSALAASLGANESSFHGVDITNGEIRAQWDNHYQAKRMAYE